MPLRNEMTISVMFRCFMVTPGNMKTPLFFQAVLAVVSDDRGSITARATSGAAYKVRTLSNAHHYYFTRL
jgi:hypothetical protein